jgi:hypothetical protein
MLAYRIGLLAVLVCAVAVGCSGGGDSAAVPPETETQGAVKDALLFADHASGTEANYTVDADEAATAAMIDESGALLFSTPPPYAYVAVAQFGENTLTGRPAMQLLAPSGARNVSPLTTLAALNPNAKTAIESLGVAYDTNLSTTATPAALLLSYSAETIVGAVTDGLNPGGDTLLASDVNVIQRTLMNEIANKVQGQSASQLADIAALTATLETALTDALASIGSNTSIAAITLNAPAADLSASIVGPIVSAVAHAIGDSAGSAAVTATAAAAQGAIISPSEVAVLNAQTDAAAAAVAARSTVTAKPAVNPPPIITGTPPTTATVGVRYYFKPTVIDTDHDADLYLFVIKNKPRWAKFNVLTGALYGTPKTRDIGTTKNIVITVYDVLDGFQHASLPRFNITVVPPTGSTGGGGGF